MDKETIPFDCKRKKTRGGSGAKSIVCCQKKNKKKKSGEAGRRETGSLMRKDHDCLADNFICQEETRQESCD